MSCVLEILSINELNIRKENLLKQLKLVENEIFKKEHECYDKIKQKKIILNNISNKNIIKIIKNKVEENLIETEKMNKNIKIKIIPKYNLN